MVNYKEKLDTTSTLTFITCGSVDDGKSTLLGKFLNDNEFLFEDQVYNIY